MLKQKKLLCLGYLFLFFSLVYNTKCAYGKETFIDTSKINEGVVLANYTNDNSDDIKVIISKENNRYIYSLSNEDVFPLQMENGNYTISILEKVNGNKYHIVEQQQVNVALANPNIEFLQSTQIVKWDNTMNSINKAVALTNNLKTDAEKVKAIYLFIVQNFTYDAVKASHITSDYVPSIDDIYADNSGICYDFSALFAAMLRSVNIPAKLIMGYKSDIKAYHSWNQIYIQDLNKWITVDPTYDLGETTDVNMIKDVSDYTVNKIY